MEKLNVNELDILLKLVEDKRDSIKYDISLRDYDIDLEFILIRLDSQKKELMQK